MPAQSRIAQRAPKVVVSEEPELDFTPEALRVYGRVMDVSVGVAGKGEAKVHIGEGDFERSSFYFNLTVEGPLNGAPGFSEVSLDGSNLTSTGLDNLIEALSTARAEALRLGFFERRALPARAPFHRELIPGGIRGGTARKK